MAKNTANESVGALYLSLGLDLSQLDADYIDADKTVAQNMKKLKDNIKMNKLQLDVDTSKLGISETDKLKTSLQAVNEQIQIQRQILAIASKQYEKTARDHGENSDLATRKLKTQIYEQKNLNALLQEQQKLQQQQKNALLSSQQTPQLQQPRGILSAMAGIAAQSAQGNFIAPVLNNFESLRVAGLFDFKPLQESFTKHIDAIKTRWQKLTSELKIPPAFKQTTAAAGELATTLAGLLRFAAIPALIAGVGFAITKLGESAAKAGDSVVSLSGRLHTTVKEAGQLKKAMAFVGVDVEQVGDALTRLDKTLLTAKDDNSTIQLLTALGVNLRDSSGALKSYKEQLDELAKAYDKAKAAGISDEFMTSVFGNKGKALYDYFDEYERMNERAANIKGAGLLDPNTAHEMAMEYNELSAQMSQLGAAVTQVFSIVSEPMIRPTINLFRELTTIISDNKAVITLTGKALGDFFTFNTQLMYNFIHATSELTGNFKELGTVIAENVGGALDEIIRKKDQLQAVFLLPMQGTDAFKQRLSEIDEEFKNNEKWLNETLYPTKKPEEIPPVDLTEQKRLLDILNGEQQRAAKEAEEKAKEAARAQQQAAKEAEQAHKNALSNMREADRIYYHQKHTDIENQIYDINQARDAQLELAKTTEESSSIMQLAAAKVADVWAKAAEKIKALNESLQEKIFNLTHGEKDRELYQLDKEAAQMRKDGASESLIQQYYTLQRAEIQRKYKNSKQPVTAKMWSIDGGDPWRMNANGVYDVSDVFANMPVSKFNSGYIPQSSQTVVEHPAQDVNYNLNVSVTGLDDVRNEVAQAAAKKIIDKIPNANNINISYGA